MARPLLSFNLIENWQSFLNASQVPYLPIFADKLSSLGFSNFGLFLVNEKGTCKCYLLVTGKFILRNETSTFAFPQSHYNKDEIDTDGHSWWKIKLVPSLLILLSRFFFILSTSLQSRRRTIKTFVSRYATFMWTFHVCVFCSGWSFLTKVTKESMGKRAKFRQLWMGTPLCWVIAHPGRLTFSLIRDRRARLIMKRLIYM